MRSPSVFQSSLLRSKRPLTWGAVLLFGVMWNLLRWVVGIPPVFLSEFVAPFLWVLCFLIFAPMPWQWSGRDERGPGPLRGLVQALPWNALWAVILLVLLSFDQPGGIASICSPSRDPGRQKLRELGPEASGEARSGQGRRRHGEEGGPRPMRRARLSMRSRHLLLVGTYFSFALLLGWLLSEKERAEALEGRARKVAQAAQARSLQNQMSPHVLFNSISGLTELVRENPAEAEEALVNLADFLRGLLDHGAKDRVTLREERQLIENYLVLEQFRLGKRMSVLWSWDESLESHEIPPLLLQPLVENAIKHGLAPSRTGGQLSITLRSLGGLLELEVANTGCAPDLNAPDGVGISNLKARLDLLALPSSAFALWRVGEWTRARLQLPYEEA